MSETRRITDEEFKEFFKSTYDAMMVPVEKFIKDNDKKAHVTGEDIIKLIGTMSECLYDRFGISNDYRVKFSKHILEYFEEQLSKSQ